MSELQEKLEETKKLYKVLDEGAISPYQNFEYEQGKEYHCESFDPDDERDCSDGFYATDLDGLPYAWMAYQDKEIWEVEVWGNQVEINEFKRRYEHVKLIRKCDIDEEIIPACKEVEGNLPYHLSEVIQPIHPFKMTPPGITDKHRELLQKWGSVRDSVEGSVRDSVWDLVEGSVRDSVRDSMWDSVRGSVRDSVRDSVGGSVGRSVWRSVWGSVGDSVRDSVGRSVWRSVGGFVWGSVRDSMWDSVVAYIGSLFNGIEDWKDIEHDSGIYPFQPAVDLWRQGLVPSFDGDVWRIHGGEYGEVLFEVDKSELENEDN